MGGNDALGHFDLLSSRVASTAEALDLFDERLTRFEADYRRALVEVVQVERPTIVCTIYNGALPDPDEARRARRALTLFNDAIVRVAWELCCAIVDLRVVCNEPEDYANPIEPSGTGGAKIARSLARAVGALPQAEPCAYAPYRPRV